VKPIVKEISEELSIGTLDRMATYPAVCRRPQAGHSAIRNWRLAITGGVGADQSDGKLQVGMATVDLRI